MYRIFIIILFIIAVSCSPQRSLQKAYIGKPQSVLAEKFGKPKTVLDLENEKVYVYEVIEELKSAEISQAKLTLDPMISPMVEKTERYYFTVKDETIVKVKLEVEYERQK
jgi:hypothetical protein